MFKENEEKIAEKKMEIERKRMLMTNKKREDSEIKKMEIQKKLVFHFF